MGSRRSSEDNSIDDKYSKGSISLEFDDYPLDLVSPVAKEPYEDPQVWKPRPLSDILEDRINGLSFGNDHTGSPSHLTSITGNHCDSKRTSTPRKNNGSGFEQISLQGDEDEDHKERPVSRYKHRCACCQRLCRPCLTQHNPLPERPTCCEKFRYSLLCPPHGKVSHVLALGICVLLVWGTFWAITGHEALPGGNFFALIVLVVCCVVGGALVKILRLPPLLGMLVVGFALRNIPVVNVGKDIDSQWSGALRNVALVVILARAGLGLDPRALKKLSFVVLRLAFLPCIVETVVVAVASHLLMGFPWVWAFILGFVLSAVTPAVVVPCMLSLQDKGYGRDQGIPTLVIAASSVDDVLAITGFTVVLAIAFSQGNLVWNIFRGPLEALGGLFYGLFIGFLACFIPHKKHENKVLLRFIIVAAAGMFAAFGSRAANVPGAGALGCLVTAFVAGLRWRREGWHGDKNPVNEAMGKMWWIFEPLLFGLIGAEIDVSKVKGSTIGLATAVLFIGLALRMVASFLAVFGAGLTLREKFFIPIAWLPKATVQAAIGSVALDTARSKGASAEQLDLGLKIVTIAVLSILVTAPLGGAAIALSGPKLLRKSRQREDSDPNLADKMDLTWDDQLDFDTELTKIKINFHADADSGINQSNGIPQTFHTRL